MAPDGQLHVYAGQLFIPVNAYGKADEGWGRYLQEQQIDAVVVSTKSFNSAWYEDDGQWKVFLEEPSVFNFNKVSVPSSNGRMLYYRSGVFDENPSLKEP